MSTYSLVFLLSSISASPVATNPNGELLEFTASWCGACQQISPMIMQLQRKGWPIRKIDVDKNPKLAKQYGITAMPSFVLVINGKPLLSEKVVGGASVKTLTDMMKRIPRKSIVRNKKRVPVMSVASNETSGKKGFIFPWGSKNKKASQQIIIERNKEESNSSAAKSSQENQQEGLLVKQKRAYSATVRLKIEDKDGVKYGTGTIIDNRDGFLVVLTCGHVLRDSSDSKIKVDLFTPDGLVTVSGKSIKFNLESDVGLISVKTNLKMPVIPIASETESARRADLLFSVGCGGGKERTLEKHKVTSINRYHGPDNVECSGVPAVGRSGGGLFNKNGEIVGVCSAADRKEKRGIYVGLKPIRELIAKSNLDVLKPSGDQSKLASLDIQDDGIETGFEIELDEEVKPKKTASHETPVQDIDELVKMAGNDAEIVCIIRPVGQPNSESRVIVINKASKKLMEYLTGNVPETKIRVGKEPMDGQALKPIIKNCSGKKWTLKKNHLKPTAKYVRKNRMKRYQRSKEFLNSLKQCN